MSMSSYRFEVSEMDDATGITADLYGDDGTIEASRGVLYDDFDAEVEVDDRDTADATETFDADVTRLEVEVTGATAGEEAAVFEFAAVGDGRTLARIRVDAADWERVEAGE